MRKKLVFLLGINVLSMFLFVRPIGIAGHPLFFDDYLIEIEPSEDVYVSNDDWGDHQRWDWNRIKVGWNLVDYTCNGTFVAFIKYEFPTLEEFQNIMDIKLIFPYVYYNLEEAPFQLNISLVSNDWNETDSSDFLWANQPENLGKSIIHTFKSVYGETIDLTEFLSEFNGTALSLCLKKVNRSNGYIEIQGHGNYSPAGIPVNARGTLLSIHIRDGSSEPYAGDYYHYPLNVYGEATFVNYTADQYDILKWSFYTHNESVEIRAMVMDENNFNQFVEDWKIYNYHIEFELLSDYFVRNYGSFNPNYSDTWYFVFIHTQYPSNGIIENSASTTISVVIEHIKNFYEEPDPEPDPTPDPTPDPIERSDNIIPFLVGFSVLGIIIVVGVVGVVYRIKFLKK